jgi:hypothetical protein
MRDRPDIQKHHFFGEKILSTSMKMRHNIDVGRGRLIASNVACTRDQRFGIDSSFNPTDQSATKKMLGQMGKDSCNRRAMTIPSLTGMPLSKPPLLMRMPQLVTSCKPQRIGCSRRSSSVDLTEDEDSFQDESVLCDNKIYEVSELAAANGMDPDERLFLEAACALSASAAPPKQTALAAIETKKRSLENTSTLSDQLRLKKSRALKQKCPMGPPPFELPSVRKKIGYSS